MDIKHVKQEINKIKHYIDDDETAHSLEDHLHQAVLLAISTGHPDPQELAKEALKTTNLDFERWCA